MSYPSPLLCGPVLGDSYPVWVYYSIYGSSHIGGGFLAEFNKDQHDATGETRQPREIISDGEIFHTSGYSWGAQDKICQTVNGHLRVVRYRPQNSAELILDDLVFNASKTHSGLQLLGDLTINEKANKSDVVSAGVGTFGTVVEREDYLSVLPSTGALERFSSPVNWRLFPRSRHYENHLHLIYDDKMEIVSFNHDYFVDQKAKISGLRFSFR